MFVFAGRIGQGKEIKKTVRIRDASLEQTKKSMRIYIVVWGTENGKQKTEHYNRPKANQIANSFMTTHCQDFASQQDQLTEKKQREGKWYA
jgi:hypothetical protein